MIKKTLTLLAATLLSATTINAQEVTVNPGATPNTWEFSMPAYDVEVETELYPEATIGTAPTAVTTTATGEAQALVNTASASATGGTFEYAIGTDGTTAPTTGWSATVPTGTDVGTYYVWYRLVHDEDHCDCENGAPHCLTSSIGGIPVDVPASGMITYHSNQKVKMSEAEAELYTVTGVSGTTVNIQKITVSAANAPMLIYNTLPTAQTFHLEPISAADPAPTDVTIYDGFKGTNEAKTAGAAGNGPWNMAADTKYYGMDGTNFVLIKDAGAVAAHRCWIEMSSASPARQLNIAFDKATSIDNGKWIMDNEAGAIYDLQGRKVQGKPARKGVYIQQGKKKVIK